MIYWGTRCKLASSSVAMRCDKRGRESGPTAHPSPVTVPGEHCSHPAGGVETGRHARQAVDGTRDAGQVSHQLRGRMRGCRGNGRPNVYAEHGKVLARFSNLDRVEPVHTPLHHTKPCIADQDTRINFGIDAPGFSDLDTGILEQERINKRDGIAATSNPPTHRRRRRRRDTAPPWSDEPFQWRFQAGMAPGDDRAFDHPPRGTLQADKDSPDQPRPRAPSEPEPRHRQNRSCPSPQQAA